MKIGERILWIGGALLVALYFLGLAWGESARQQGVASFAQHKRATSGTVHSASPALTDAGVGSSSAALVSTPPSSLPELVKPVVAAADSGTTIAVLRIPRIALEVPVADGTTERVLRAGAGLVEGTATPGGGGNIGIAAHRDTYFRGLKDVVVGDLIELETLKGTDTYRVSTLSVVAPTDVYVLDETTEPALTLVTCYPFYFVGNAPQRYIVRAVAAKFQSQNQRKSK